MMMMMKPLPFEACDYDSIGPKKKNALSYHSMQHRTTQTLPKCLEKDIHCILRIYAARLAAGKLSAALK